MEGAIYATLAGESGILVEWCALGRERRMEIRITIRNRAARVVEWQTRQT